MTPNKRNIQTHTRHQNSPTPSRPAPLPASSARGWRWLAGVVGKGRAGGGRECRGRGADLFPSRVFFFNAPPASPPSPLSASRTHQLAQVLELIGLGVQIVGQEGLQFFCGAEGEGGGDIGGGVPSRDAPRAPLSTPSRVAATHPSQSRSWAWRRGRCGRAWGVAQAGRARKERGVSQAKKSTATLREFFLCLFAPPARSLSNHTTRDVGARAHQGEQGTCWLAKDDRARGRETKKRTHSVSH